MTPRPPLVVVAAAAACVLGAVLAFVQWPDAAVPQPATLPAPAPAAVPTPAVELTPAPAVAPPDASTEPEPPTAADGKQAEADVESEEEELERLVTTWPDDTRVRRTLRDIQDPEDEEAHRRDLVLKARARAEDDIAAGAPRIVSYGLTSANCPDVDPETGYLYRYLGCTISREDPLDATAYNSAIRRARREGRIAVGSFLDRFVNLNAATAWIKSRGVKLERGGEGVRIPGTNGIVRIPGEPSGSRSDGLGGIRHDTFDIDRPSARANRVPGWPSLHGPSALVAFREDGRVYLVAEPADAERWTTCHVFDAATGYHLHTLDRPSDQER